MGLKQKAKGGVSDFCFVPRTVYQGFEAQKPLTANFVKSCRAGFWLPAYNSVRLVLYVLRPMTNRIMNER
jgi:hypothetical protein